MKETVTFNKVQLVKLLRRFALDNFEYLGLGDSDARGQLSFDLGVRFSELGKEDKEEEEGIIAMMNTLNNLSKAAGLSNAKKFADKLFEDD